MMEKLVLVTRQTRLEGLIERFNSRAQSKFYIEHAGGDFADYEAAQLVYGVGFRHQDGVPAAEGHINILHAVYAFYLLKS